MPVTILGVTSFVVRAARDITTVLTRRGTLQAQLLYGIYQTMDGQRLVYARGKMTKSTLPNCPEPAMAFKKRSLKAEGLPAIPGCQRCVPGPIAAPE